MERSRLSHFIQMMRKRRGFSVDYAAHLAGLKPHAYIRLEERPETTQLDLIWVVLQAFEATESEYSDFNEFISELNVVTLDRLFAASKPPTETDMSTNREDVKSLAGLRSLNNPEVPDEDEGSEC